MADRLVTVADPDHPVARLRVTGCLDMASAVDLRSALQKMLANQPAAIVVDVAELVVADDLAVLAFGTLARQAAGWPDCRILLYGATGETRLAFDRMAVSRQLTICRDADEALRRAGGSPSPLAVSEHLPATPNAAAVARRLVVETCERWNLAGLADPAEIVVTELVGNAVRHARPPVILTIARRGRSLYLGVRDGSPEVPRRLTVGESSDRGRGLLLIDAFAAAWGTTPRPGGKLVWATLRPQRLPPRL